MSNGVKYISIEGKIQIPAEKDHQEFLNELYKFLKSSGNNYHFVGSSKIEK